MTTMDKIARVALTLLIAWVWWNSTTWFQIFLGGAMTFTMLVVTVIAFIAPKEK